MRDRDSFQNSGAILKEMRNKSLEDIAISKHKKNKHKHPVKYADDDIEKYKGELLKSYEKIGALESELKEKNEQLKNLVDLAFQKGISYATDVARDLDNPYLMDAFHDTLVDKLHKELVERGKLEEI